MSKSWERGGDAVAWIDGTPTSRPQWGESKRVRFLPTRTDNLRPAAAELIGRVIDVEFAGTMDDGVYAGQSIWELADREAWIGWIPDEDLADTI